MGHKKTSSTVLLFAFICAGHFCVDFMLGIWPVFKTIAQLDLAKAGLIVAACTFVAEMFQCPFGAFSDHGYQKPLLISGICLTALCSFLSYAGSYLVFFFLILGSYIGSAAFHPTAASILGGVNTQKRSTMMGYFSAAGMLGLGVSQLLFSHTYHTFDGATYFLAVPSVILAVMVFLFLHISPKSMHEQKSGLSFFPFKLFFQFFKYKPLRILYIVMIGNQIALWSTVFLLPDFLLTRGFSPWVVYGGGHFILMLGSAICPPLLGVIADRSSIKPVLTVLLSLAFILFYTVLMPVTFSEWMLFTLLFLLGGVSNSVSPLVWSLGNQLMPANRGLISAFLMGFVWIVSETVGIGLSGVLAKFFEEDAPAKALACMGSMLFLSLIIIFRLPKPEPIHVPISTGDTIL